MYRCLFFLLIPIAIFSAPGVPPSYTVLKHREHQGVGYTTGYSSIEIMANLVDLQNFYPFLNVRGHVFDDGRPAANAGLALRYISANETWVFGANVFYDFRSAKIFSPQQAGGGLELFYGKTILRANGYMPFGTVKKKGHCAQAALANIQGEAERLFFDSENFSFRGSAGVYYLAGRALKSRVFGKAWGSQIRLTGTLYRWIEAGIETTYDHIFNFTFQGYLGLRIPLGNTRLTLPEASFIRNVFYPIRRNEIIPLEASSL